ncbi:MAG: hypothetical protein N0E55_05860, partial [Candidatus Thiodiazotropha taylori]|nr:hypothetical protein [Candidatus Thiodiazotropha taylori]MCW4252213.1 hypothetical protein [Candidatus Thiodiazotropha taylori]
TVECDCGFGLECGACDGKEGEKKVMNFHKKILVNNAHLELSILTFHQLSIQETDNIQRI